MQATVKPDGLGTDIIISVAMQASVQSVRTLGKYLDVRASSSTS